MQMYGTSEDANKISRRTLIANGLTAGLAGASAFGLIGRAPSAIAASVPIIPTPSKADVPAAQADQNNPDDEDVADGSISGPISATLDIDWSNTVSQSKRLLYGSNDILIANPNAGPDDPEYAALISEIGIKLLRFHGYDLHAWTANGDSAKWNEDAIAASYNAPYLAGMTIIQTVFECPKALNKPDGWPDPVKYANYCADLVNIVNNKLQKKVPYWEPMNEWTDRYASAGKLDELCDLYNQCANAMKRADPTIKVGGLVFSWADVRLIEPFVKQCAPNIDFVAWHTYGTGERKTATDLIMSNTHSFGDSVHNVRRIVQKYIPNRTIELAMDEYNVNYSWQIADRRQWTNVGAVFVASAVKHLAEAGLDIGATWNLKDKTYGMIDPDNHLRPEAVFYKWANHYLVGSAVLTKSTHPMVEAFAVLAEVGSRSILVINKSAGAATVTLNSGWTASASPLWCATLDATTMEKIGTAPSSVAAGHPFQMEPYSLKLLRM